jgi:menaquinone-dependent protoporphyrinogen IX oxidase
MSENKKTVVVYRSGSGFTKKYAAWLAQELKCDLRFGEETRGSDLLNYETIIYGAGLYAVGIRGLKLITRNYELLKDKNLIVFAVGASPVREETAKQVRDANIPAEMRDKIHFFYLRGGFDYSKLSPMLKLLMQLKRLQLKSMKNPDADAKGMLASYEHPVDFTNIRYIKPILECAGEENINTV